MRAGKTIGVALAVLVAAAVATVWLAPPVAAAGQQTATMTSRPSSRPTGDKQAEKKIERQVIVKKQEPAARPITITVDESRTARAPKVMTHALGAEPMIAALGRRAAPGRRRSATSRKEDVAKLKLAGPNGVVVDEVTKESAAEKAGVKAGDVVVQFDGENVRSAAAVDAPRARDRGGPHGEDGRRARRQAPGPRAWRRRWPSDTFDVEIDDG